MLAIALAMSATVTPDSFASWRSLARLDWTIDTTTQPNTLTRLRIRVVSTTGKMLQRNDTAQSRSQYAPVQLTRRASSTSVTVIALGACCSITSAATVR